MPHRLRYGLVALLVGTALTVALATGGSHGTFLRPAGPPSVVVDYGNVGPGNNPVELTQAIQDEVKEIAAGEIRMTYDTWVGRPPLPLESGGAALAGGFFMNPGVRRKEGFQLGWVQTVIDNTATGGNAWNLPAANAGRFPDANPGPKTYPNQAVFVRLPPGMNPTLGYTDYPERNLNVEQTWMAELGLVCIADTPDAQGFREVRVIGTIRWGFEIDHMAPAARGIEDVHASSPVGTWGNPTQPYLNTLNGFYDGLGGGGGNQDRCTAPAATAGTECLLDADCDSPPGAGNGVCTPGGPVASGRFMFAHNTNCFELLPNAGNGLCEPTEGEDPCNAPSDCPGDCPTCGDGFCQSGENSCECPSDCPGSCPGCGDGECDVTEEACDCPSDCPPGVYGSCPFCGDGVCDSSEDSSCFDCAPVSAPIPATSTWGAALFLLLATVWVLWTRSGLGGIRR